MCSRTKTREFAYRKGESKCAWSPQKKRSLDGVEKYPFCFKHGEGRWVFFSKSKTDRKSVRTEPQFLGIGKLNFESSITYVDKNNTCDDFKKKLCWPTKNKLKREKNLRESSWFSSLVRCCICDNPSENFPADQVTSFSSCSNPSFFSLPMLQNGERYLASNQRVKQGTERHRTQTSQLFRWFLSFFTNQGQKPKVNVLFLILIIFFLQNCVPKDLRSLVWTLPENFWNWILFFSFFSILKTATSLLFKKLTFFFFSPQNIFHISNKAVLFKITTKDFANESKHIFLLPG